MSKQSNTAELQGKTKAELTDIAEEQGVDVNSHMTKAVMVDEIQAAQSAQSAAVVESAAVVDQAVSADSGVEAVSAKEGESEVEMAGRAALGR